LEKCLINIYEEVLSGARKKFPDGTFQNEDNAKILIRYLFLEKLKLSEADLLGLKLRSILKEYNLIRISQYFNIYEKFKEWFPEFKIYDWYFWDVNISFWNDENILIATDWLINRLIKNNIIHNIDDIPKKLTHKLIYKYRLSSLVNGKFNGILYDYLNYVFPNRWKPFQMNVVQRNYWEDKSKLIEAIRWLICDRLNITKREDLLKLQTKDFNDNNLGAAITHFNCSVYKAISTAFPELNIREYEMNVIPTNYWKDKQHRISAMKWLIEDILKLDLSKVPSTLSYTYIKECFHKFSLVLDKFYNSNIYLWINEVYPNIFNPLDFKIPLSRDGLKMDSKEEVMIHHCMLDNYDVEVNYYGTSRKYKIYNNETGENYIPDWILNNNFILEYFGWFHENRNENILVEYVNKTYRKIEFYNNYCNKNNMKFIALYPEDLKNNLQGVKEKLNIILN